MHQLIYALVSAPTPEQALSEAKSVFDGLTGGDLSQAPVFDYYVTFDESSSRVAGPARWGDRPTVARIDSPAGQRLLDSGWEATEREFYRTVERVREALSESSDEELMGDAMARHACRTLGAYRGPSVYLYDEHGQGIRHREALDRVLDADDEELLWIVPADVHF
ncbi:hypothetical protein [Halomarina rubra]|uniref:DUF7995 domain-containing protein n=1 Tax=Halomarina rubra TaxID=2071873 RepID=A0ABD6AZ43_9EURY|nr:hypothetical protein [Halomarina rubra]